MSSYEPKAKLTRQRNLTSYSTEIQFIGDWDRVARLLGDVPMIIDKGSKLGQQSAAKKLMKIVKHHIKTNGGELGWPSTTLKYQENKAARGFDPGRLLYMTGTYYWSIKQWEQRGRVYVGIPKGTQHPTSKLTVAEIANILEHGSQARSIPPRPLWAPSFRQMGGSKKVRSLILWHIAAQFRLQYGISPKITN